MQDNLRRKTRTVMVRDVAIGSDAPISVQSMTKTDTADVNATVRQIRQLERCGCDIIRVAVLNKNAALAIGKIKPRIHIPLVADIHFDHTLALRAMEQGADKIRLNPGNIRKPQHIEAILAAARHYRVPIRIGVNSGSVPRRRGHDLVRDITRAAQEYVAAFRKRGFDQIVLSLKTPDVRTTIESYRRMAELTDLPFHLGVTATGLAQQATVKSSIGIGALLLEGIGDTLRVSLSGEAREEVRIGLAILAAVGLRNPGIEIIACPTCGRCSLDLVPLVKQVERRLWPLRQHFTRRPLRVAIMGCVVNGPGEAQDADIGIAWGKGRGILFKQGKKMRTVNKDELLDVLYAEVRNEMDAVSSSHA